MPRLPKDPKLRQRRNKVSTRAELSAETKVKAPPLPAGIHWHPLTRAWWKDVWASPMAAEFLKADQHGLFVMAQLVEDFWRHPTPALAAEIRLQGQRFGLSPIDRRKLQWSMKDEGPGRPEKPREPPTVEPRNDPRNVLRAVK